MQAASGSSCVSYLVCYAADRVACSIFERPVIPQSQHFSIHGEENVTPVICDRSIFTAPAKHVVSHKKLCWEGCTILRAKKYERLAALHLRRLQLLQRLRLNRLHLLQWLHHPRARIPLRL